MPGKTGIDYLQEIRDRQICIPVLMVTGMNTTDQKVKGLDTGADDYLTKPFEKKELIARVNALLRRPKLVEHKELKVSGVVLDTRTGRTTWHGREIKLTKQEYLVLEFLMRNKNEAFSQEALVARAWSSLSESSPDTVRVHMHRLRKKFEDGPAPCPLQTVHGQGYKFVDQD